MICLQLTQNTYSVKDNTLNFITLFRRKDKLHAVLFSSHLLAIAIEQIHFIVISFVYLEYKQHFANQIIRAGNILLTHTKLYTPPCLGQ